jgi:hypothetical protein
MGQKRDPVCGFGKQKAMKGTRGTRIFWNADDADDADFF